MKDRRRKRRLPSSAVPFQRKVIAILSVLLMAASLVPSFTSSAFAQESGSPTSDSAKAKIDITFLKCDPTSDDAATAQKRTFEDLSVACTSPVKDVDIHLTSTGDSVDTPLVSDNEGKAKFTDLDPGTYTAYTEIPRGTAWEVLYCTADGGTPYQKTFNDAIVTTFEGLDTEQIECSWFVIPTATDGETPAPRGTADAPDPGATDEAGDTPTSTSAPEQDLARIDINTLSCPDGPGLDANSSYDDLAASCAAPLSGITVHLTDTETSADSPQTTGDSGSVSYPNLPSGTYTAYTDILRGTATEVVWCVADGGNPYQKTFDDAIVTTFDGLQREQIVCSWFVIPTSATAEPTVTDEPTQVPTETSAPTEVATATTEPTTVPTDDAGLASITFDVLACAQGVGLSADSSYDDLVANCQQPDPDVTVHFGDTATNGDDAKAAGNSGTVVYSDLQPGTYTAYTDIPRTAATEVVYCSSDGGAPYRKDFNDAIVTTFEGLQSEEIVCSWFVIAADVQPTATGIATTAPTPTPPTGDRTDETGGSLTVHLAACPTDYKGSTYFDDCHGNGVGDMEFMLTGPDGTQTKVTSLPETPGPGIANFTGLAAGNYTLAGGPPGDFGSVVLYCTTQPDGTRIDTPVDGTQATFSLADGADILCDWYFIPENLSGATQTPVPTPTQATRAEILVTLHSCPAPADGGGYGGATYDALKNACGNTVNDVPYTLGDVGAPPLTANTGVSGAGAVRFYDLLPADYTLSPKLPSNLTSTAVFCRIGKDNPYQKALQNGAVTFVNVDGDSISCDWFAVETPTQTNGPTGSITVREYLCAKDKESIKDWDRECVAGTSGGTFKLTSTDGTVDSSGKTDKSGVLSFKALEDGHYTLKQTDGSWCRATADRVDSESRVIVADGKNTDVVIYQCNQVTGLPNTGTGTPVTRDTGNGGFSGMIVAAVVLAFMAAGIAISTFVRTRTVRRQEYVQRESADGPVTLENGMTWMRFK